MNKNVTPLTPLTPLITLDQAAIALGGRTVLREVSFEVHPGQFIAVLGANGAGKTTLFRALLGLIPPAAGRLHFLGKPIMRGPNPIGYMPQMRYLPRTVRLTGAEFVLNAAGDGRWGRFWTTRAERQQVAWALDMVGASALADRAIDRLSGGERQRLLLAQTLLGRPQLLLLDEPLAGLDPRYQQEIVAMIDRVRRTLDIAVLFSAHDINPLMAVADQVLYLAGGQAVMGTVDQVITGPVLSRLYGATIKVARIDGRMFVYSGAANLGSADEACAHHQIHRERAGGRGNRV